MIGFRLAGFAFGKQQVMFENVKNLTETFDEDTNSFILSFNADPNGEKFTYIGNEERGYREKDRKAPSFFTYRILTGGRITRPSTSKPRVETPEEDPEDDWIKREGRRVRPTNAPYNGCGGDSEYYEVRGGCGGSSIYQRGSCGGWTLLSTSCGGSAYDYEPYHNGCGGGC